MPVSCDPDATILYALAGDAGKPAETRPAFVLRFMSRKEHQQIARLSDEAIKSTDDAETFRLVNKALKVGVVGARNIKRRDGSDWGFSVENIDEVLSDREIWELLWSYPVAVRLGENDRGKSLSQSASDGALPASHAAAANA